MSAEKSVESDQQKSKMLEALLRKQKENNLSRSDKRRAKSKIGVGNLTGAAPKIHRRKTG